MFDDLTWDAILQAWPWFAAAAIVFVVAVGLFIALKPKPKRQPETGSAADEMEWTLTRRIDLADPQSVGAFVVEVEEISDFHELNWSGTPRNSLAKGDAT